MSKTVKKNEDAKLLEGLCGDLEVSFEQKRKSDAEIKAIKAKVLEIVKKDPQKYFDGLGSFKVGQIEIYITKQHTYELGGEFDSITMIKKYPNAVKVTLIHSEMKNIPLAKLDIEHVQTEKMEVAYKPVKELA